MAPFLMFRAAVDIDGINHHSDIHCLDCCGVKLFPFSKGYPQNSCSMAHFFFSLDIKLFNDLLHDYCFIGPMVQRNSQMHSVIILW